MRVNLLPIAIWSIKPASIVEITIKINQKEKETKETKYICLIEKNKCVKTITKEEIEAVLSQIKTWRDLFN